MKKLILTLCCALLIFAVPGFAIEINIYDSVDNLFLLETFEDEDAGWYRDLQTDVGTFAAGGRAGTGATSYNAVDGQYSTDPYFSVQRMGASWFGRKNTTPGGNTWLDSGDITDLTLYVDDTLGKTLSSLYFYMLDPSDCGATTTVASKSASFDFSRKPNGGRYLVGITWDPTLEILESITWSTNGRTADGYGLDDFATAAPVPEPATMMLLGVGLLWLAGIIRKKE